MAKPEIIILNSKDKNLLKQTLEKQFGITELPEKILFCVNKKEKIFLANKELFDIDHDAFRVNAFGNYFGTIMNDGFRLSIEGSQLLGPLATKNIVELTREERDQWILGDDLDKQVNIVDGSSYGLIRFENDFYSCGKVKDNKIINYVSKARKLKKVFDPKADNEE
jgi:NOL1/NOP2/fmu family ribosome biogenesis protein